MSFSFCVSVIIVVQHVGHPVQLRDFHAAKASLAPQILDFYPKIGIAGVAAMGFPKSLVFCLCFLSSEQWEKKACLGYMVIVDYTTQLYGDYKPL